MNSKLKMAIVAHIDSTMKSLEEQRDAIDRAISDMDTDISSLKRVKDIVLTGQDPYERCANCDDPLFCHDDEGCSGPGHSSCDCAVFVSSAGGE